MEILISWFSERLVVDPVLLISPTFVSCSIDFEIISNCEVTSVFELEMLLLKSVARKSVYAQIDDTSTPIPMAIMVTFHRLLIFFIGKIFI